MTVDTTKTGEILDERVDARMDEILTPGSRQEQDRQAEKVQSRFLHTLRRAVRHIPFIEDAVASYHCAFDPKTPPASRGVLLAALAYFVLPFDIVPDFIIGLGFADDAAILLAAYRAVSQNITAEHYLKARETLKSLDD